MIESTRGRTNVPGRRKRLMPVMLAVLKNTPIKYITYNSLDFLTWYDWPGGNQQINSVLSGAIHTAKETDDPNIVEFHDISKCFPPENEATLARQCQGLSRLDDRCDWATDQKFSIMEFIFFGVPFSAYGWHRIAREIAGLACVQYLYQHTSFPFYVKSGLGQIDWFQDPQAVKETLNKHYPHIKKIFSKGTLSEFVSHRITPALLYGYRWPVADPPYEWRELQRFLDFRKDDLDREWLHNPDMVKGLMPIPATPTRFCPKPGLMKHEVSFDYAEKICFDVGKMINAFALESIPPIITPDTKPTTIKSEDGLPKFERTSNSNIYWIDGDKCHPSDTQQFLLKRIEASGSDGITFEQVKDTLPLSYIKMSAAFYATEDGKKIWKLIERVGRSYRFKIQPSVIQSEENS